MPASFRGEPIRVLPLQPTMTAAEVLALDAMAPILACDFYIEGIEHGEDVAGGYRQGRILNVDHHAPTPRMRRRVSSTNLAIAQMEADDATAGRAARVAVNHLDCDSVLSGGIMAGRLPPEPRFGESAIAADHTGEENAIADLLQGLDAEPSLRGPPGLEFSFASLDRLLSGLPLDTIAREALEARLRKRSLAEALVARGAFDHVGPLSCAVVDSPIDGEFFPALMPEASIIALANPLPDDRSRWQVKIRLGLAAPDGLSLSDIGIEKFDPRYGGRWNAGSNRRGGGTDLPPDDYFRLLESGATRVLGESGPGAQT